MVSGAQGLLERDGKGVVACGLSDIQRHARANGYDVDMDQRAAG